MPINGAIIKKAATGLTVVGGTDATFNNDGTVIQNGVRIIDKSVADFRIRPQMTLTSKQPTLNNGVTYSRDKRTITISVPKILADGSTQYNRIRCEREVHPESTAAEALDLNMLLGQCLSDSDFSDFWVYGSLL
jgi:hypothetical protein